MFVNSQIVNKEIEIFIKQGDKAYKVVLSGEALENIENLSSKLGTKSILESILYSAKIISEGINNVETGEHKVLLPNGKKVSLKLETE